MEKLEETLRIIKIERKWNADELGLETFLTLEHLPIDSENVVRRVVLAFDAEDAEELLDRSFKITIVDAPRKGGRQQKVVEE
jgi:hypothetical protein